MFRLITLLSIVVIGFARIPKPQRKFSSAAVDAKIEEFRGKFKDGRLYEIFENAFPNTLDTTISSFKVLNFLQELGSKR